MNLTNNQRTRARIQTASNLSDCDKKEEDQNTQIRVINSVFAPATDYKEIEFFLGLKNKFEALLWIQFLSLKWIRIQQIGFEKEPGFNHDGLKKNLQPFFNTTNPNTLLLCV